MKSQFNKKEMFHSQFITFAYSIALLGMIYTTFFYPLHGIAQAMNFENNNFQMSDINPLTPSLLFGSGKETGDTREETVVSADRSNKSFKGNNSNRKGNTIHFFESDIFEGSIGSSKANPIDHAYDNVFLIHIDETPTESDKVFITYELFGFENSHSLAKTINHRMSTGGYMIKYSDKWTNQKEEINPEWIKHGENSIVFNLKPEVNKIAKVKNLG
jgi:hypothetical protein